jgi:hypothetical protein
VVYLVITYKNFNPLLDYFNCDTARTGIGPILGPAPCTDKKERKNFLIYNEIQTGSVAKSYMTNGLLIYD